MTNEQMTTASDMPMRVLLAGPDTLYFSCDLPISEATHDRLSEEKATAQALPEERRDIVWSLLHLGGLLYDLERRAIVGLIPRPDVLHVLTLGLAAQWERRGGELWLRQEFIPPKPNARR